MTPDARISAAIEVLADIVARRRPAADSLKDWGLARRYAGSKDRAAVAGLVYDALRRRASASWLMGSDEPRAAVLGMLRLQRDWEAGRIAELCTGLRFAPPPLTDDELARLNSGTLDEAPSYVRADVPDWIVPSLRRVFGEDLEAQCRALAGRAPLDLRVNTLKATRADAMAELAHLDARETPWSPDGLRVLPGEDGRGPHVQSEPAFLHGQIEIQDEGSQLATLLAGAEPGMRVVDVCAGGGGKTLALAARMADAGRIYATDSDTRRLAPIHERLARAGIRTVEVRTPRARQDAVSDLDGTVDLVLVDAPCTGSGTWRRNPDAKWRLRPGSLSARVSDQANVLDRAARLVRPGGRIVYVTCSVLPEENDDAVAALLSRLSGLSVVNPRDVLARAGLAGVAEAVILTRHGLQMTPLRTGTDGFYVAALTRGS